MSIKHIDLIPDKDIPFKHCKLGREVYADILTSVVENYKDGFVLAVNNPWGAGKTTFVRMWQQQLENTGFRTIYFNAWENDLGDAVFPALLSELETIDRPEEGVASDINFRDIIQKAVPFVKSLMPIATKLVVDRVAGKGAYTEVAQALAEGGAELLNDEISDYKKRKEGVKEFKDAIEKFVATYTSGGKPVVFIIDELDRCRPNYSVTVLENIKHLFSVPGVVFVLSIDKEQLGYAIRGVYGSEGFDAPEYLRRFIDLEYSLPRPNYNELFKYFFEYFDYKGVSQFKPDKNAWFGREETYEFFGQCFEYLGWDIRRIEKIMAQCKVSMSLSSKIEFHLMPVFLHLSIVKIVDNKFFREIESQSLEINDIYTKFFTPEILLGNSKDSRYWMKYCAFVMYSIQTDERNLEPLILLASSQPNGVVFESVIRSCKFGELYVPNFNEICSRIQLADRFDS